MKLHAKHNATGSTSRQGVAALVVGGLVAGTVATAGAVAFTGPEGSSAARSMTGDVSGALADDDRPDSASDGAAALASLRSGSLDELREQGAANRSQARTAPEDAEPVQTVLADAGFAGHTPVVEEPVVQEPVAEPVEQEPVAEAEAPVEEVAAAPVTQEVSAPAQAEVQQAAAEPAPEPAPEPEPEQAAEPAPSGGGVLGVAASYVGSPYQLYGTPPNSFDCSGFTWWVYNQAGISVPKSVAGQRGAVTPVSNPQPGDLVIYNDWHHVGIYAGNGMTYEALNPSTGVRYGPILSSNVWYGRFG
ncbi:NlpC/P60 family protein [Ornithinimicrobium sp. LYQ92]|uniref:C40 family peptidase n=1 Tax=Serinicoccus sp. LYQ92 TaxID=3378798 RepID=UPI003851F744